VKKLLMVLPMIAALAACETQDGTLAATTLAGAVVGSSVSGSNDRAKGAIIGAGAGLLAGTLINRQSNGNCTYQRPDGSTYVAACP
jgi:outer membrane lipoprotein SlyB